MDCRELLRLQLALLLHANKKVEGVYCLANAGEEHWKTRQVPSPKKKGVYNRPKASQHPD